MSGGFMSSENPQPADTKSAQRQADVYDVLAWLEVNKMKVAVIALILVVIGFAVATMRYLREQKETQASSALLALKASLTPSTNTPPVPASAFAKVAQDFSGTAAADRARILAAASGICLPAGLEESNNGPPSRRRWVPSGKRITSG